MKKEEISGNFIGVILIGLIVGVFLINMVSSASQPEWPDSITVVNNETKTPNSVPQVVNISGGRIATLLINATIQNSRWKAFVGNVTGTFTLDDASGNTIYDWSLTTITGEIYATRNSNSVNWASINCSNITHLENENTALGLTNPNDNLTATFTVSGGTHNAFYVGSVYISANSCPTLNTYNSSGSQDNYFEEIALYDGTSIVFATILEEDKVGFDGATYDFQMIVPENGTVGFSGRTPYYVYIELS